MAKQSVSFLDSQPPSYAFGFKNAGLAHACLFCLGTTTYKSICAGPIQLFRSFPRRIRPQAALAAVPGTPWFSSIQSLDYPMSKHNQESLWPSSTRLL
ncbi:hypothetical protein NC651_021728 [Populus alba x Populus x berolinensis]|nr:hypothetical protein NC651_021728 [Populus alba x Populus x berolinensis]